MTEHWGVVGGGMLGLALAQQLRQHGQCVTVLEAAPQLGGLAAAWQVGNVTWDRHYHVILVSDAHVHRLLQDLGLQSEFVGVETQTGFYTDGHLYSMSNTWEFLRFPPLGLLSKLRLALTILHASRIRDWRKLETIPVLDWLTRWSGQRTVEKLWRPLLRAKLGDSYHETAATFIWATIARMYAARRSGLKKELFGYVRGGYARILDRFAEHLTQSGVELRTDAPVATIESACGSARVTLADGEQLLFDRVICTAAAPVASRLIPGLKPSEHQLLQRVRYQGIVCASVLLKYPLDRFYVTNITDDWVPFTAVIEMSALVDRTEFQGHHLVYLPKYVAPDDPMFDEPDNSIRERFVTALERMYPRFRRSDVLAFKLSRVRHVFAVPSLNGSARIPPLRTSLPGVYLVNSAQIINGTLNVNETLQLAAQALPALLPNGEPADAQAVV
jgi:protoporphyrinogen oxidase